jgi:hypothetical protein
LSPYLSRRCVSASPKVMKWSPTPLPPPDRRSESNRSDSFSHCRLTQFLKFSAPSMGRPCGRICTRSRRRGTSRLAGCADRPTASTCSSCSHEPRTAGQGRLEPGGSTRAPGPRQYSPASSPSSPARASAHGSRQSSQSPTSRCRRPVPSSSESDLLQSRGSSRSLAESTLRSGSRQWSTR